MPFCKLPNRRGFSQFGRASSNSPPAGSIDRSAGGAKDALQRKSCGWGLGDYRIFQEQRRPLELLVNNKVIAVGDAVKVGRTSGFASGRSAIPNNYRILGASNADARSTSTGHAGFFQFCYWPAARFTGSAFLAANTGCHSAGGNCHCCRGRFHSIEQSSDRAARGAVQRRDGYKAMAGGAGDMFHCLRLPGDVRALLRDRLFLKLNDEHAYMIRRGCSHMDGSGCRRIRPMCRPFLTR